MWNWITKHKPVLVTVLVTVCFALYCYGCESKTESLNSTKKQVTRQELQIELESIINLSQIRFADLDRQDELKTMILQNALVIVQGQPFNPLGILTGIATLYGVSQAGSNITKTVKKVAKKRKVNNGTG